MSHYQIAEAVSVTVLGALRFVFCACPSVKGSAANTQRDARPIASSFLMFFPRCRSSFVLNGLTPHRGAVLPESFDRVANMRVILLITLLRLLISCEIQDLILKVTGNVAVTSVLLRALLRTMACRSR